VREAGEEGPRDDGGSQWSDSGESSTVWSESEDGQVEEEEAGDRWMRRRGRRHWREVRGVVLKGQLATEKRLCAIWLDELIQVRCMLHEACTGHEA
jgi:hypothetical protein